MLRGNGNKIWFVAIVAVLGSLALGGATRAGWREADKLLASDVNAWDEFGHSVYISADQIIVGAPYDDDNGSMSGSAYIFKRDPDTRTWSQQAKLTALDGAADDYFGISVAISGDYAIVGANQDDDDGYSSGSAYIFKRDPGTGTWSQQAKLTAADGVEFYQFGITVSISGECAIVGSHGHDGSSWDEGAAYIFEPNDFDPNNWQQQAMLTAAHPVSGGYLGRSVSISGNYAIAGAPGQGYNGDSPGSAYIFEMPLSGWTDANETAKLTASDGDVADNFGISVSISDNRAIVGAYLDDDKVTDSGSAYIFEMPPTGWADTNETAKLIASDGATGDGVGYAVSISTDYAIVGSYGGDGNEPNSGAAYIFAPNDIDPNNWDQQAKLAASDGVDDDRFGLAVSISAAYAVAGVPWDDDGGDSSGSAFVLKLCPAADLSDDCCVNLIDFALLGGQWGQTPGEPSADIAPEGGDGVVNLLDLDILADQWLQCK